MSKIDTIPEQKHKIWKTGTIISAILCIILFVIFWNIENPFWISISRLGAFIFFALTVLGYLKLMNGPLEVTLKKEGKVLVVAYKKDGEKVHEEQFEFDTIKKVQTNKKDKNILLTYLQPESTTFSIHFTDTDRVLYLFEFSGRPLLFSSEEQKTIIKGLEDLNITVEQN